MLGCLRGWRKRVRNGQNTGDGFCGTRRNRTRSVHDRSFPLGEDSRNTEILRAAGSCGRCCNVNYYTETLCPGSPRTTIVKTIFDFRLVNIGLPVRTVDATTRKPITPTPCTGKRFSCFYCRCTTLASFFGYRVGGFTRSRQEAQRSRTRNLSTAGVGTAAVGGRGSSVPLSSPVSST